MARRIIIEAVACVTKYFVAASVDRGFFLLISMGIIASRLNSRPTHISIRLVLDISSSSLSESESSPPSRKWRVGNWASSWTL